MSQKPAGTHSPGDEPEGRPQRRIGVYICHCGGNISDYVDVDAVRETPVSYTHLTLPTNREV